VLVDRYASSIYRFALRFSNDERLSEDISQEVFLRVYRHALQFDPRRSFTTWLFTIARNVSIDAVRAARVRRFESLDDYEGDHCGGARQAGPSGRRPTLEEQIIEKETEQAVRTAVHALPEKQRSCVILRFYEGMTAKEIAQVLDCSASAVESLLVRAKNNLAKSLFI
jgi:RNA polymerase sigma-70 factor (ECF subfamily)